MTICYSHKKEDPFIRVDKAIAYDTRLSLKAKGILLIAFSRPDNWKFYKKEMMSHSKDGRDSFESGIRELEEIGYLHRARERDPETNQFKGWEWHFFETPISTEEFQKMFPKHGFPAHREMPTSGKPAPTKNNLVNKNERTTTSNAEEPKLESEKVCESSSSFSSREDEEKMKLLDGLPINDQTVMNMMQFDVDTIKNAIHNTNNSENVRNYGAYLFDQARKGYKRADTPEEAEEKNKQKALKTFGKFNMEKIPGKVEWTCEISNRYIEFSYAAQAHVFLYTRINFIESVNSLMERSGSPLRIE